MLRWCGVLFSQECDDVGDDIRAHKHSVFYLIHPPCNPPHIFPTTHTIFPQLWWSTAPLSLQSTLWTILEDLPSDLPLLLLATADCTTQDLLTTCPEALQLFASYGSGVYALGSPGEEARRAFFEPLCEAMVQPPQPPREAAVAPAAVREGGWVGGDGGNGWVDGEDVWMRGMGGWLGGCVDVYTHPLIHPSSHPPLQLPIAPDEAQREAQHAAQEAARAARAAYEGDQAVLRALRQALREVTYRLIADRRWQTFVHPVEDPEYWAKV